MTVTTTDNKKIYTWDNVVDEFSYPRIQDGTDLFVSLYDNDGTKVQDITSDKYTISTTYSTGILTITDAATLAVVADKVVLQSIQDLTQTLNLGKRDFPPEECEREYDKGVLIDQQLQEQLSRGVQSNILDDSGTPIQLPVAEEGEFPVWTSDGNFENSGTTVSQISVDAANAAASAAAAAISETNAATSESNASTSESNAATSETNAAASEVAAGISETNAGISETNAATSETNAAASAAAAEVAKIEWQGTYNAGTAYALNDAVTYLGSSFICIQAGTGQTPVVGGTAYWDDLANKGDSVSADWGTIGGTLSDQTDLQNELDLKANLTGGTFSGDISVPDEAYGVGWDASVEVPTKNAIYDKIETLGAAFVPQVQFVTSTSNLTVPAGATKMLIELHGGGGGGGASDGDNAGTGGTSTVNYAAVTLTANGGTGGTGDSASKEDGGVGGTASGGDLNYFGEGGTRGYGSEDYTGGGGSAGGAYGGAGARERVNIAALTGEAGGLGAGGGGGKSATKAGAGGGAGGLCIKYDDAANLTIVIGAGGSAGTGGTAGGAGGAGLAVITWY